MNKVKISYFENVGDTVPKDFSLNKWLKMTINPPADLERKVQQYRNLKSKRLKQSIPCVTISASFKKHRNLDSIKKKNNFIVLDIDRFAKNKKSKCNDCIDFERFKSLMMRFKSTLYVGYSVSSDGIEDQDGMYAIIVTHEKDSLKKSFKFYKKKLARIGVNIDESCKDYTRLRFFSHDPNAYYNPKAVAFKLPKKEKTKRSSSASMPAGSGDLEKVMSIIQVIERDGIDITSEYDDWYKIAGALNGAFGEQGRELFHRVSKFHPEYHTKKTDSKYSSCSKMKYKLSSFFYVATQHNIRY